MSGGGARPLWLAHRGDHRDHPENTTAAFQAAVRAGFDGVELDVRTSADGEAVVIHDATLQRVQGVDGVVGALTAGHLGRLDVPTLGDVLRALPPRFLVDVELKELAIDQVVDAVRRIRGPAAPQVVLSSFDTAILAELRDRVPDWPRWLISTDRDGIPVAADLGCSGVALHRDVMDADTVAAGQARGLAVIAWAIRDEASLGAVAGFGPDGVIVDAVEVVPIAPRPAG